MVSKFFAANFLKKSSILAALVACSLLVLACANDNNNDNGNGGTVISICQLIDYLGTYNDNTIDNPITVKVEIDLDTHWGELLTILNESNKYVTLDLSNSTGMKEFNPNPDVSNAGEQMIANLILPNSTTGIVQDIYVTSFRHFTNLTSISFPASVNIGMNPFIGCNNLTNFILTGTGSLSAIENGKVLVRNNTELVAYPSATGSITMSNITAIGESAFKGCDSLTSVSFPAVTSIGLMAFVSCVNLTEANFPAVTSIDRWAFMGCIKLTRVTLGTIAPTDFDLSDPFPGELRAVYFGTNGGAGTYTRDLQAFGSPYNWEKK